MKRNNATQHEEFEVSSKAQELKRLKIIRQDRFSNSEEEVYLEILNTKYEVVNYSSFGVAIRTPKDFKVLLEADALFLYHNIEICNLHLKLARIESDIDEETHIIAFEIVGEPIDILSVNAVKIGLRTIKKQNQLLKNDQTVPSEFRHNIYELKDFLEGLKLELNSVEEEISKNGNRYADQYRESIATVIGKYLYETVLNFYQKTSIIFNKIDEAQKKYSIEFFRRKMNELMYAAPIVDRIYNKPLGYAGDYEMMNIIYKTQAEGLTLFNKCIHNLFIRDPAAEAVRNRAEYLCNKIKKLIEMNKELKILSVASGPAMEIQLLLDRDLIPHDTAIEINLLDQDEDALKHAQYELKTRLKKYKNIKVNYLHIAVKNIIARGLDTSNYDLIYSAGLFDYFSDPVAQLAVNKLITNLKQKGQLIIGNFNTSNPSRPVMEIALDWHLIYRSEKDLERLYSHYGSSFNIEKEHLGINLFCIIEK
jgi:extracellular factor (EF) 3-hydroxypalmitic acid methyl ester biosynthesis protein